MVNSPRCLYNNNFPGFIGDTETSILGVLCNNFHGVALTTTREAWKSEITIMREMLTKCSEKNGVIIFEYDIPRLGKRVDVVLLYKGIFFALNSRLENRISLKRM